MKIAIIGGTGSVGRKVVEQCLENGDKVIVVARNPKAISTTHERLETRAGDVSDEKSIEKAVLGTELIVSAIGMSNAKEPTAFYSEGMTNIVKAMQSCQIKRIIAVGASGYVNKPRQTFLIRLVQKYIIQKILRYTYEDLMRMETVLRKSNLDWTIVRPTRLTHGKRTGKYRAEPETVVGGTSISRADVADFIVNHLTDQETYRKAIGIAY
ncbi:MAG: NAD(P)-dependent oxidoreductase [Pyrinomonadaceae bacterium]